MGNQTKSEGKISKLGLILSKNKQTFQHVHDMTNVNHEQKVVTPSMNEP